jgi:hypothetical protein
LFVTGKSPRCFKNVKKLPAEHSASRKAWMAYSICSDWLLALEKPFNRQTRRIELIIENCSVHSVDVKLTAIKLFFLSPNTSCILQPCDQDITQNLKFHYKKLLPRKYLTAVQAKQDFGVKNLGARHLLGAVWSLVTSATMKRRVLFTLEFALRHRL